MTQSAALDPRQILTDGSVTQCCDNCNARYSYDDFWHIFDDLCLWLGNGPTLWTNQAYYTQNYYCSMDWDANVCVHLQVQYLCGVNEAPVSDANPAGAMAMDYAGSMVSSFSFAVPATKKKISIVFASVTAKALSWVAVQGIRKYLLTCIL